VSTASEHRPTVAFEDYLTSEQTSERPHEWVAGRVYNMSGGTERHDLLAGLLYERLAPAARRRGCRPFAHNRLVRIGGTAYYPDVLIVCKDAQPPHRLYERDLSIVVEVLSPSSRETDYREKAAVYTSASGFQTYLLADPERRQIDVCTRGADGLVWETYPSGHVIPDLDLDVDELYDALDETALT
jgi:Uma2 family endonuclease